MEIWSKFATTDVSFQTKPASHYLMRSFRILAQQQRSKPWKLYPNLPALTLVLKLLPVEEKREILWTRHTLEVLRQYLDYSGQKLSVLFSTKIQHLPMSKHFVLSLSKYCRVTKALNTETICHHKIIVLPLPSIT